MIASTNGQQLTLKDFLARLPEMIDENERIIADFEANDLRAGGDGKDTTSKNIAALKRHNVLMQGLIDAIKPAQSQNQVKG